ncbi:F-box domain [Macleaya cordata]|uniref:F-box domain n=1 Tax=Macleaya cordata TaxID=56857 RepID=A0A200PTL3_MACCD|nr:F-box domain [Macleaya cordata]
MGMLLKFLWKKEHVQGCTTPCNSSSTTIDDLDDNLLCQILTRVPAKSIAQLKVMNKQWNSLISNPFFIVNHALHQSYRNASGLFHNAPCPGSIVHFSFDLSSPTVGNQTLSLGLPEDHRTNNLRLFAASNGLLFLMTEYYFCKPMYISNPTTKKSRCIPSPGGGDIFGFGLAVDPTSFPLHNHYKVVGLYGIHDCKAYQFKIFTPEIGCWRDSKETISYKKGRSLYGRLSHSVYFREALHWLTSKGDILAFDVGKEKSWMIKVPRRYSKIVSSRGWFRFTWFGVVDDRLNLVRVTHDGILNWALHDYENKRWEIRRRFNKMWSNDHTKGKLPEPIFYDGEILVLNLFPVIRRVRDPVPTHIKNVQIHNLRTGVSVFKFLGVTLPLRNLALPLRTTL